MAQPKRSAKDDGADGRVTDEGAEDRVADEGAEDRVSARELTLAARRTIEELTGVDPEAVTGLQWDGETWLASVDVCELARVPNSTDVMATYVVQLDDRGELLGYKRERRFVRGQAGEA